MCMGCMGCMSCMGCMGCMGCAWGAWGAWAAWGVHGAMECTEVYEQKVGVPRTEYYICYAKACSTRIELAFTPLIATRRAPHLSA